MIYRLNSFKNCIDRVEYHIQMKVYFLFWKTVFETLSPNEALAFLERVRGK
jgi:hypothetical protein